MCHFVKSKVEVWHSCETKNSLDLQFEAWHQNGKFSVVGKTNLLRLGIREVLTYFPLGYDMLDFFKFFLAIENIGIEYFIRAICLAILRYL